MIKKVRAVIVSSLKILLIKRVKSGTIYYVFPGGSIEQSDISHEACIKRECQEELGVEIDVHQLFEIEDTEAFYFCSITTGTIDAIKGPEMGRSHEIFGTYEPMFVPISRLSKLDVRPSTIRDLVTSQV